MVTGSTGRAPRRLRAVAAAAGVVLLTAVLAVDPASPDPQAHSMLEVAPATGSSSSVAGLHPDDISDAYALTGGVDGLTVGIVVADDTPTLESDLGVYRSTFGLPPCTTANGCFRKVDQNGGTSLPAPNAGWGLEASLDVQAASAACPGCKILVVEASNTGMAAMGTAVNTAVSLGAAAVSASWGSPENGNAAYYSSQYFTHPGVPVLAATGDTGYPETNMPAVLPNVIAVGGTTLSRTTATPAARTSSSEPLQVSGSTVRPATTLTAAAEHLAALHRAQADLARANTSAKAAATALTAAKKAAATAKQRLAKARAAVTRAKRAAARAHSATADRALAEARSTRTARTTAYRKATALVTARTTAARRAHLGVSRLVAAVARDEAQVRADQRAAQGPIASAPVAPTPIATTAPTPTPSPTQTSAPTPTPTPSATPQPVADSAARGSWMETAWSGAGSGCSTTVAKPTWQTDTACSGRTVADVSADADPATGLAVYDTYGTTSYTSTGWVVAGGTSLATPLIAGMLVRSGHAADYSNAAPLYADPAGFWDVTSGSSGSCAGSPVCTGGTGYDGPTGLGTPKSLASF